MTLTFKDPNSVECELAVRLPDRIGFARMYRMATTADLLAALGQLSTGSDGPTDEETELLGLLDVTRWDADSSAREKRAAADELLRRLRANPGILTEAAVWRAARAKTVLRLEEARAEVDRLTAELAEYREQVHQENLLKADLEAAESELAATKARLEEMRAARDRTVEKLAEVERERDSADARLDLYRRAGRSKVRQLEEELASARRVVEAAAFFVEAEEKDYRADGGSATYCTPAFQRLKQALASAAPAACSGCGYPIAKCRPLWSEQRKCCPDCSHAPAADTTTGSPAPRSADSTLSAGSPISAKSLAEQAGHSDAQEAPVGSAGDGAGMSTGADGALAADRTEAPKCEQCFGNGVERDGHSTCGACDGSGIEPPRAEAGESAVCAACEHTRAWHHNGTCYCGRCAAFDEPTEEPKPEPQPSACFTFAVGDTVRILNGDDPRTGKTADVIGLYPKECATLRVHGEPPPRAPGVYPAYPLTCLEPVEPQSDAPLPLPWRLEFDGALWSVMSADGQHVADDLREADARYIVDMCNPVGGLRSELRK